MTKFKKIGEIQGFERDGIKEVLETLEKQGLMVVDDDVLIATVNENFDIEPSDGGFYPFNEGDGFIEDIENVSVRDVVYAILGNMKMAIAEDMSVTHKTLDCIDDILKSNGFEEIEVTTCNGHKY